MAARAYTATQLKLYGSAQTTANSAPPEETKNRKGLKPVHVQLHKAHTSKPKSCKLPCAAHG